MKQSEMIDSELTEIKKRVRFVVDSACYLKQFENVFLRPIRNGYDALPVGNGDLAAIVWQPDHLTWMLNKSDISGEASQAARVVIETPKPLADRVGRLQTRLSLANSTVEIKYTGGELGMCPRPDDIPATERMVTWRGVTARVPEPEPFDLGTLEVSGCIPHGRNVLLLSYDERAEAPHPTRIRLERWLQSDWGRQMELAVRERMLTISYALNSGVRYAVALAFDGFDGANLIQPSPLQLAIEIPATTALHGRLAVAVVTSYEADDPLSAAMALAKQTLSEDPVELKKEHDAFWSRFWNQCFVESGHPYANMLYHMAIYELGITSLGHRPVKFNGALNLWNERPRAWGASYWCHNQHSVYLPAYAANHPELADNFLEWIVQSRPEACNAAKKYFGVAGAYYPETMHHDFKVQAPDVPVPENETGDLGFSLDMKYILSSGTRYAILLWDRYRYTLDEPFLREKAYPVLRDVAEFYVNYGKLGEDGRYHVEPSLSWEERPVGRDGHADCAAWRAIFSLAIKAAAELGVDQKRATVWKERLRKAPPYPVVDGLFSAVVHNDGTPEPPDHFQWQVPNISSVFPYGAIGLQSTVKMRKLAEATFERYRFNADAGHEYLPLVAARLGLAEGWRAALYQFMQFFQVYDNGLFNYYSSVGNKDEESTKRNGIHPYLESSGIFSAAVNEMLLQSHDGTIRVFAAVPERWHSRFILRAAGSFLVASEHRGREGVPYILIQPLGGKPRSCRVVLPWSGRGATVQADAVSVPFQQKGRIITFQAEPGTVYAITPLGRVLADVSMVRIEPRTDGSPARLGVVWYGNREGADYHTSTFPLW